MASHLRPSNPEGVTIRRPDVSPPLCDWNGLSFPTLMMIGSHKDFKFHPRCRRIKLNHLSFADDLMLFCKANLKSAQLLCQGLDLFAATSGLCANLDKSAIYLAGIPMDRKVMIAQEVHLPLGSLPFLYLGIPLTSRRISAADCNILIDKMASRF